ncbi:hypothetical protein [Sphingomonas sp. TREG-RG-20F-R18-01]|uniref:hypothetical protein n=1 Tax=Sphingomonas sp. TREG-RG-20F-R18-01 TaxID=2914982 RepID=UPI001F5626EB
MRDRRVMLGFCALLAIAALARHPTADIRVLTHQAADPMPHQVKAALDLGVLGISILYTWTAHPVS